MLITNLLNSLFCPSISLSPTLTIPSSCITTNTLKNHRNHKIIPFPNSSISPLARHTNLCELSKKSSSSCQEESQISSFWASQSESITSLLRRKRRRRSRTKIKILSSTSSNYRTISICETKEVIIKNKMSWEDQRLSNHPLWAINSSAQPIIWNINTS